MFSLSKKSNNKYEEARKKMRDVYIKLNQLNSNIPDYNPFEVPFNTLEVDFPSESIESGTISHTGLFNALNKRITRLRYKKGSSVGLHSHYGYWEYLFIESGEFSDHKGKTYIEGDSILIDGYNPHTITCNSEDGRVLLLFSSDKNKMNIKHLRKYINRG